jgi:hypothetical protein
MKEFNYTGICIPSKRYMVHPKKKIDHIIGLIEKNKYFTINLPRQYGKSTSIYLLEESLKSKHLVISTSFEGIGETFFSTEKEFCRSIIHLFIKDLFSNDVDFTKQLKSIEKNVRSFPELSETITNICNCTKKKIILFIDEVDKASNYRLFLNFLGMLRNKYLKSQKNRDSTFYSVVLAGVHDIKNLNKKIRDSESSEYDSPWNIATDFNIDMSFSIDEISDMLAEYERDHATGMDINTIARILKAYTNGYPYLVSKLCYIMDQQFGKNFSEKLIEDAINILLNESNTLFDDLLKNISRYSELNDLLERITLNGLDISYNYDAHNLGIMYGILGKNRKNRLIIHNKVFELRLYNYFIANRELKKGSPLKNKYETRFIDEDGNLDIELLLTKFQELMKAEYRHADERFVEREGRLLFLAFLKPVINGEGFYFVEPETRNSNRMDIVITLNQNKFVIELKIWHGEKYAQEGREQLCNYLDSQNLKKGYMVFFNFNQNKSYEIINRSVNNKDLFEITV